MNSGAKVSRRGVYYDLSESPYEYKAPYGDIFKFSSQKKLEIYTRDIEKELERIDKLFARNGLDKLVQVEVIDMLKRLTYKAFYKHVER